MAWNLINSLKNSSDGLFLLFCINTSSVHHTAVSVHHTAVQCTPHSSPERFSPLRSCWELVCTTCLPFHSPLWQYFVLYPKTLYTPRPCRRLVRVLLPAISVASRPSLPAIRWVTAAFLFFFLSFRFCSRAISLLI